MDHQFRAPVYQTYRRHLSSYRQGGLGGRFGGLVQNIILAGIYSRFGLRGGNHVGGYGVPGSRFRGIDRLERRGLFNGGGIFGVRIN
jgi:hypothetical protein